MSMRVLVDPRGYNPVAKLYPNEDVEILDRSLSFKTEKQGIEVDDNFRKKYGTKRFVYPAPDKAIFAIAFEQIFYKRALERAGYKWKGPEALEVLEMRNWSDYELAKYVIRGYQEEMDRKRNAFPPEGLPSNKRTKSEDSHPSSEYY